MLDRESTFADPEIVVMLKTRFVPVAIDQWYTRRQQDTEGEFYRKIAGQGPRNNFNSTTQGLYIADPSGKLIAFNNNRGPERIRGLLNKALADYVPPNSEPLVRATTDAKYKTLLPAGGIVVRVGAQVTGGYLPTDDHWQKIFQNATARDNLWITANEQQTLKKGTVPKALQQRIARFHLVDNTRGEPPTWTLAEIRALEMSIVDGEISGRVHLETDDHARGYEATLRGTITWKGSSIAKLDLLADGQFWGAGTFTLKPPEGKFPLVIAFRLADGTDTADSIPPHSSRGWLDGYLDPRN